MPIILLALGLMGLIIAGGVLGSAGLRPAGALTHAEDRERVQASQFATFARAALNTYTNGGSTPPSPCYAADQLHFAPGFTEPAGWGCLVTQYHSQNLFWVYGTLKAPTLSYLLSEVHGQTFGVNHDGTLDLPGGGQSTVPVPALIPNGDVASLTATQVPPFDWATLNGDTASGTFVFAQSVFSGVSCGVCCSESGSLSADFSGNVSAGVPFISSQIVETSQDCSFVGCTAPSSTILASGSGVFGAGPISAADPAESVTLTAVAQPAGITGMGSQSAGPMQTDSVPWS